MTDSLIVSTQWLADHLHDPDLRIIDIRGRVIGADQPPPHYFAHRADYEQAHIPGAVFVDWTQDITDPASPNGTQIAAADDYATLMKRLGVGDRTFVVAYDDAAGMFAARLWWTLGYYGHRRAAILDGGWKKWVDEGRPTTGEIPVIAPAVFTPRVNRNIRRTIEDIAALVGAQDVSTLLIDVRTVEEFVGQASRARRSGHIPGAVNLARGALVNPDETLPSQAELRSKFADAGVDEDTSQVILYCNSGVSSSYAYLALRASGYTGKAAVYDGSWKEWGNDETRPIS
jgi:thiosulfate/3-mercaptopyruvate sulfurtransferase